MTLAPGAVADVVVSATPVTIASQLTALETSAVSAAAQTAATQQTSLATLFANLGVAAGLTGLPPQVQQAVVQVLAQQTILNQGLTGDDIKQAFQTSGLFLEHRWRRDRCHRLPPRRISRRRSLCCVRC